jgi:tricarballylate dehydrogenase
VVVGAGCAGLCAALAAAESGAHVVVLERAPREQRGGDTAFSIGAMLFAYDTVDELLGLVPDLPAQDRARIEFGTYPVQRFRSDLARVAQQGADPDHDLVEVLATRSLDSVRWLTAHGVRFDPMYGSLAVQAGGMLRFLGGLTLGVRGGGVGLVDALMSAVEAAGVEVRYGARAVGLDLDDGGQVRGAWVRQGDATTRLAADAVVLAAGGFQSDARWRARHLGAGWDRAKVRGTPFNTGDGIRMGLEAGAVPFGNWSGCHAVTCDRDAPEPADRSAAHGYQRLSYPYGIMVNADGRRFVDEGADLGNYTYARYGREILQQPGQHAWQVFDSQVSHLLRDEYRDPTATFVAGATLEELAARMRGVATERFLQTVAEFNAAVVTTVPFAPERKDGRRADLRLPKSNWALRIDQPPFAAYPVTCGVTFTFGGLKTDEAGRVLDTLDRPIPGLLACGELVGGVFSTGCPGGAGLTAAAVLGRTAGTSAAGDPRARER